MYPNLLTPLRESPFRDDTDYPMPRGSGKHHGYFVALEDVDANGPFYATESDRAGATGGEEIIVHNWANLITGAKAGYHGQYCIIARDKDFQQGPCVVPCYSDGSISGGNATDGTEDIEYVGFTVVHSGLDAGVSASGLPPGLAINSGTGEITGTPTTAGTYTVILTGTAPGTGDSAGQDCTITKVLKITILPPE